MFINMAHGSGGQATHELIEGIFRKHFSNEVLDRMEDSAVLNMPDGRLAFTTDSFVVKPLEFKGGDIGKLAICGTVNDLSMAGAVPQYLTAGFIIEEGLELSVLDRIVASMKRVADEANIKIVAGDTKVIEGKGGLYINTSGIGVVGANLEIGSNHAEPGDAVLINGSLGNHHACILSDRMGIGNHIMSDCAPLCHLVEELLNGGVRIKCMRDVTRGGLATVLNEIAGSSGTHIELMEKDIPVDDDVRAFCGILGLDPLTMGNEGKMICIVPQNDAKLASEIMQKNVYGKGAALIGKVLEKSKPMVTMVTPIGGRRIVDVLYGEGLPRIC